jgi:uncharacterized protein (DUF488 family)
VANVRTLYTLGYEKRTQEEFFGILHEAEVSALIDVRDVAWSHKPGFAKGSLQTTAATAGMEYVHAQFAGNPKRLRKEEPELGPLLATYGRHLEANPEILEHFTGLIAPYLDAGKRVCIMCLERDPAECHRGVLAAKWSERAGGRVEHLGIDSPAAPSKPA